MIALLRKNRVLVHFLLIAALPTHGFGVLNPTQESQIDAIIGSMTLDEKLGQISLVAEDALEPAEVASQFIGGLLVGASRISHPSPDTTPVQVYWADRYDGYKNGALATRLKIPLFVFADAVHGHGEAIGATVFPHNIGLAATNDPDLMEELGVLVASEVASTGVDGIFAPCIATNRDVRWGRTYEGWSEDPVLNAELSGRFIRGVQTPYNATNAIIATAKHFVGDGGATWGTGKSLKIDQGDVQLDEATLRALHLPPYVRAIEEGVGSIMVSYGKWNGVELHHQHYLLTDLLKDELGFEGIVMSDFSGFIDSDVPAFDTMAKAAPSALNAGMDLFMMSSDYTEFAPAMKAALTNGQIQIARIDDAVRRILRIKLRHGLYEKPLADRTLTNGEVFGNAAHGVTARKAVEESLVLLKNRNQLLPLATNKRVLVVGPKSDDIGVQCGGWTVEWAGLSGTEANLVIPGTTLVEGIRGLVEPGGGTVTYSADATAAGAFDVVVVAVGELPTAEWFGDTIEPALTAADKTLLETVRQRSLPTVVVIFGNRPLTITERVDFWDTLIMAWLPGTEGGAGLANTIFGKAPFSGRLPVAWHRNAAQIPIHFEDQAAKPLYPQGYGLSTDSIRITTSKLTPSRKGTPYSAQLESSGISQAVFSLSKGGLPEGISLNDTGLISGTPIATGYYSLMVKVVGQASGNEVSRLQSYTLSVVDGEYYEHWALGITWPAPSADNAAPDADPDRDGMPNQLEFFLNSDPIVYNPEAAPSTQAIRTNGLRTLLFHYTQRKSMAPMPYVIEGSTNLMQWNVLSGTPTVLENTDATTKLELKQNFANNLPYFIRLRLLGE